MKRIAIIVVLALAGCEPSMIALPEPKAPAAAVELAESFNPDATGTLQGTIRWNDPHAKIAPIARPLGHSKWESLPNPNSLHLDGDRNLAGAVVLLRGVEPALSKPWPHPAVEVELHERGITVHQGSHHGRTGFVRRGDNVTFRMTGERALGLRARGADFFAIMLPPKQARTERVLANEGRIDLASASGQFWASASLYICDHPYYTDTDAAGRYTFTDIPPGRYELVVEHPNWNLAATEIDPESGLLARQTYARHYRESIKVDVLSKQIATQDLSLPSQVPPELR